MQWLLAPEPMPTVTLVPSLEQLLSDPAYLSSENRREWLQDKLQVTPDTIKQVHNSWFSDLSVLFLFLTVRHLDFKIFPVLNFLVPFVVFNSLVSGVRLAVIAYSGLTWIIRGLYAEVHPL